MLRKFLASLVVASPLLWTLELRAQTAEPKLAALEKQDEIEKLLKEIKSRRAG